MVSPHKRYTHLMAGKDAHNFDPTEVMNKKPNFEEWMRVGYEAGFIGAPVCYTHDGLPTTEIEDEEFGEGDPCIHILRLYYDENEKRDVEQNHSPSQWRASNRGL